MPRLIFPRVSDLSNELIRSSRRPLQVVGLKHSQFMSRSRRLELDRAGFIFDFESMVLKRMNLASLLQDLFLPDVADVQFTNLK